MPDLLDLLQRLTATAQLYLRHADPQNGVPRSVVFDTRDALAELCAESDRTLRASASPRENNPENPVQPERTPNHG